MGIVLLLAALGFLVLAKSPTKADPGGMTRLAGDGLHNAFTEMGREWAFERLKTLTPGPAPSWLSPAEVQNPRRGVVTLVPGKAGNSFGGDANAYISTLLAKLPAGGAVWTDATLTELAFTDTANPPLSLLSAKFNLLTKREWGWPVPKGKDFL